jgi:Uri superfamily endonuclease
VKGTYTIIVECGFDGYIVFGKLGRARLSRGHYLYTGSALGAGATSLMRRLERHERRTKRTKWHIDYLTTKSACKVKAAVYLTSGRRLECKVNRSVSEELNLYPVLPKIGASDCNCAGHLLGPEVHLSYAALLRRLVQVYRRTGLSPSFVMVRGLD